MAYIEISVAATSRALLTAAQLRAAAGSSKLTSAELAVVGLTVADIISDQGVGVVGDGVNPPTLLRETLVETFYPERRGHRLELARRFIGTVAVVEDGTTLTVGTDYSVDKSAGVLTRRTSGSPTCWRQASIVVTYQAGFATVPTPLADVAAEMVARRVGDARDPMMKRERIDIPGVRETEREYWVDAETDTDITPDMAAKLDQYRARGM